jgi:hypothetical protein
MTRLVTILSLTVGALWVTAACASAQPLVSRIAAPGLVLTEVRAPDDVPLPVRLVFARSAQARAEVRIDVLVTASEAEALSRAEALESRAALGLPALEGIGARAWGHRTMVVLARGPVAAEVRVLAGAHDAVAIARALDAELAAGTGRAATAPRLRVDGDAQGERPLAVRFDGDVVASWLSADGAGYARSTERGWVVARTGPGAIVVRALAVTPDLRVHELTLTR